MAQNYTIDMFAPGNQVQIDMQNIEHNLECLRSMFSGLTTPANAVRGQTWYDLGKSIHKQHNGAGWIGLMQGDANQKFWMFRNDAMAGWIVDADVSDTVLAIKNTAAGQVYSTGGAMAGDWSISGIVASNTGHTHSISTDGSHTHGAGANSDEGMSAKYSDPEHNVYLRCPDYAGSHSHGGATVAAALGIIFSHDGVWRPLATVGTLQFINV